MRQEQADRLAATLGFLRKRQRISQVDLGRLAGVSRSLITMLERGLDPNTLQPPNPQAGTLRKLARGLATDGLGALNARLEVEFYRLLLDAAGHLPAPADAPEGWTFRDYLAPHVPPAQLDAFDAEYGHLPYHDARRHADHLIRLVREVVAERTLKPLDREHVS